MKKILTIAIFGFFLSASFGYAYNFTENVRFGTTNSSDVLELQKFLIDKGFLEGTPNGSVYSVTQAAIKKFQSFHNLYPDGIVGPNTRSVLNRLTENENNETSPVKSSSPLPLHLVQLAENLWQPICNGPSECIDPTFGGARLFGEAQWLLWSEQGNFDDSVTKTLNVVIANCESSNGCVVVHTYEQTHKCRNEVNYGDNICI